MLIAQETFRKNSPALICILIWGIFMKTHLKLIGISSKREATMTFCQKGQGNKRHGQKRQIVFGHDIEIRDINKQRRQRRKGKL